MRYLRAHITTVQTKSLRCRICQSEVTQSDFADKIADGEHTFSSWVGGEPMSATFSLKDPKLYDYSLSLLDSDVLLGIEKAVIVSIEPVKRSDRCHMCNAPTLKRDFDPSTRIVCDATSGADSYYGYYSYEPYGCDIAKKSQFLECVAYKDGFYDAKKGRAIKCEYLIPKGGIYAEQYVYDPITAVEDTWIDYASDVRKRVGGTDQYKFVKPTVDRTKITFRYYCHYVIACKNCNNTSNNSSGGKDYRMDLDALRQRLYENFATDLKTYNLHGARLTSWT